MLRLHIESREYYDDDTEQFVNVPGGCIELEHSLVSISEWESEFQRSFLKRPPETEKENNYYIWCMLLDKKDGRLLPSLSNKNKEDIQKYIQKPMTATYIMDRPSEKNSSEVITSELIYCWMINLNIPFECQHWHINRLLALIKVVNVKNSQQNPHNSMSKNSIVAHNRALNASRLKKYKTKG